MNTIFGEQIMKLSTLCASILASTLLLTGCGDKENTVFTGKSYQPTQQIATAFQYTQVPGQCLVFAHVLATFPEGMTGLEIRDAVFQDAASKGADMVLVGQGREMEDNEDIQFLYFGPEKEYLCRENWHGWKFGYNVWGGLGDWVSIGQDDWGNQDLVVGVPAMVQVAYLKCK